MKQKELTYENKTCTYDLLYQNRKTLTLTVYPDNKIVVKSPHFVSQKYIVQFLKIKWPWITKKLNSFNEAKRVRKEKRFVSGETFLYLGQSYEIAIKQAKENKVILESGKIWAFTKKDPVDEKHNRRLINEWYKAKAEEVLGERFDILFKAFDYSEKPKLRIRSMKTLWGSCSKKGSVTLNLKLIQMPESCIDYVIMHELCHLKEHNHSAKYYKVLTEVMPDWKIRKKHLMALGTDVIRT